MGTQINFGDRFAPDIGAGQDCIDLGLNKLKTLQTRRFEVERRLLGDLGDDAAQNWVLSPTVCHCGYASMGNQNLVDQKFCIRTILPAKNFLN